jgi:4-amino-4-deoxy-L-arabinose transferase-like glycosyltransferase
MDEDSETLSDQGEVLRERPTLEDDLRQMIGDARGWAEAELVWQKARALFAGKQIGVIALLGLLALVLVFFSLMALVLGLVLALTPMLGAWGAMAAVTGGLLLAAALAALLAALRARRMLRLIADRKTEP